MEESAFTRRNALIAGAALAGTTLIGSMPASGASPSIEEVDLTDDPTRGYYAHFDLDNFGPVQLRDAKRDFVFPANVEQHGIYGIDVSHHAKVVPWEHLSAASVSYVYVKASQSVNGRDAKFREFWDGAASAGLPRGAYHFLTAGVSGTDQAAYFLKRLGEIGGLKKGHLQPVLDLEWDIYGPDFKLVVIGTRPNGDKIYKDYWDGVTKKSMVDAVNNWVKAVRSAAGDLAIKPLIYTNRSWWEDHVPAGTVFENCTIWISDYRKQSYIDHAPRSVAGHDYYLWQFTDKATIAVGARRFGPYDSNRLLDAGIEKILIR